MVNIFKHVQYCEGRGYVNSGSLNDAMSKERGNKRVAADFKALSTQAQQTQQRTVAQNAFANQAQFQAQAAKPTLVQQVARFIARPLATANRLLKAAAQVPAKLLAQVGKQLQNLGNIAGKLAAQIGSFFLNTKESRNEKDDEGIKKRDEEDIAHADMFEVNTIKEPSGSSAS